MIGTVISYCTNDYRFLGKCIEEARRFSSQIVVAVCDHFFNGTPENRFLLDHTYSSFSDCTFVEFSYTPGKLYSPFPTYVPSDTGWIRLWHQTGRYVGFLHIDPKIEYVLFLDSDEIADGNRFKAWLETKIYQKYDAMRLLGYYYALRSTLRAKKVQDVALLAKRASLEPRFFFHIDERYALYKYVEGPKIREVRGHDQKPLFHHYSWVRSSKECYQKADSWGHRDDINWPQEIKKILEEKRNKDLFGNIDLEFEEISESFFDPLSIPIPKEFNSGSSFVVSNIKKVTPRDIFQMEIEMTYGDSNSY